MAEISGECKCDTWVGHGTLAGRRHISAKDLRLKVSLCVEQRHLREPFQLPEVSKGPCFCVKYKKYLYDSIQGQVDFSTSVNL